MEELTANVNWLAVGVGTVAAYGLGMLWFSPMLFGKVWAKGSHDITPPESLPIAAMLWQLLGTFLLAWLVGVTAKNEALLTIVLALICFAILQAAGGLFSQKSKGAASVDAGYVVAMGVIMIVAQGVF
ncbi:MAG: DUF1761 domain-containing protein [Thermoanaerobaculia bacterium]|nr:DUF1761 domain-containing protein [Thermoanaerobaculia bacterium]